MRILTVFLAVAFAFGMLGTPAFGAEAGAKAPQKASAVKKPVKKPAAKAAKKKPAVKKDPSLGKTPTPAPTKTASLRLVSTTEVWLYDGTGAGGNGLATCYLKIAKPRPFVSPELLRALEPYLDRKELALLVGMIAKEAGASVTLISATERETLLEMLTQGCQETASFA